MNEYSNAEMTDMHYVSGAVDGNGRAAALQTLSVSQTDVSQVMFCLDNCTADCINLELSKYVATLVENLLHARLS